MAKTESTAVNQLIASVKTGKSIDDPAADLFSAPKPVQPARMTSTIPPLRGAGEVAPLPRSRTPSGTSQHQMPAMPPAVRVTTAPPRGTTIPPLPKPTNPATTLRGTPAPQILQRPSAPKLPPPTLPRPSAPSLPPPTRTAPPVVAPVAAPFEPAQPVQPVAPPRPTTLDHTGDAVDSDAWFEPSRLVDRVEDEAWLGTHQTPKTRPPGALWKKLVPLGAAFVVLGILVGGYIAFDNEKASHKKAQPARVASIEKTDKKDVAAAVPTPLPTESTNAATATADGPQLAEAPVAVAAPAAVAAAPAPAPAAAPVPAPAPAAVTVEAPATVHEVKTTRGIVKLVDVRIDSKPAGATVMLVDNGKTSFLGTTPVSASVDPARAYDVIFTLEGHATQMAHFDPNKTRRVDLLFAKGSSQIAQAKAAPTHTAAPAPAPAPAPSHHATPAPATTSHVAHSSKPTGSLAEPSFDTPAEAAPAKAAAGGSGTLMVSSKPPCQILIDGQDTGLTTPQRAIPLAAGPHKITFVNASDNVNKTVAVSVRANQPTKLIQNFMP